MKCDVIIPVYKAPEWVKLCVYALFTNTDPKILGKVYLINDCDDKFTTNCLKNLKSKYGGKVIIKQNSENLGFVKTVNRGLKLSTSECVLLLNSDCLLAKNGITKLMKHLENDSSIGLICPLASNAANITIPIPEGWNYTQIDALLEKHFSGQNFDACTVVGNCLMITRRCLDEIGLLDEAYGTGYGEETDYQFKAMAKGFTAKVAIDTYVFHKAEASFGNSKEKQARLQKNRDIFFSRWGEQYKYELKKYEQNDPIKYINSHLPKDIWKPNIKTLFYIDGIVQNAGGVHIVVDIVNYLTICGESINILFNLKYPYQENMLFNPISADKIDDIKFDQIVSTVWKTAFTARAMADSHSANLLSFIQGYESYFENGTKYGAVELSYKLSNSLFTISKYLQKELKETFDQNSKVIHNGINYDLIHHDKSVLNTTPTITIVMRGTAMKGDWLLIDILKKLNHLNTPLQVNLVSIDSKILLPQISSNIQVNTLYGPQDRNTIYQLLQQSDFYIDTSLSEGFGLTALEAMAAGCIPIVSDSLGINEYIKNNENGIIVKEINNSTTYIQKIKKLLSDSLLTQKLIKGALATAKSYDFDQIVSQYSEYFNHPNLHSASTNFSKKEQSIIKSMRDERNTHARNITMFNVAKKITPRPIKKLGIKIAGKIYNYVNK